VSYLSKTVMGIENVFLHESCIVCHQCYIRIPAHTSLLTSVFIFSFVLMNTAVYIQMNYSLRLYMKMKVHTHI